MTLEKIKEMFMALKLHFTSKYDFVKYHGRTRASKVQARERYALERIARKFTDEDQLKNFFVANMANSFLTKGKVDTFIGNYATKEAVEIMDVADNWWNATSYNLATDLRTLSNLNDDGKIGETIRCVGGDHPQIFTQYLDGKISFNTIVCVVIWRPVFLTYWEKNCEDTILFGSYINFLKKYIPLISKDKQKITEIIEKTLTSI
jgi:hypothetical protein